MKFITCQIFNEEDIQEVKKHSRKHTYQYIMWLNVFLDGGKRDGKFYKTYPFNLIKHKFKLLLHQ
jgi:hypothetical protein